MLHENHIKQSLPQSSYFFRSVLPENIDAEEIIGELSGGPVHWSTTTLTLAGTGHFAYFHGTRGGGEVCTTPLSVSPLIELELRGKNERVARRETKRLIINLRS